MGLIFLVVGLAMTAVSLGADSFGIGEGTAIGYKQSIGAIVGIGVAVTGLIQLFRK